MPNKLPPIEDIEKDGLSFDKIGRMHYHPDYHPNHGKPFSQDDLIYLCKFHRIDGIRKISYAIGKTETTIASKLNRLRENGLYDLYRAMPDEKWIEITILKEVGEGTSDQN